MIRKHTHSRAIYLVAVMATLSALVAPAAAAGTTDPGQVARDQALNKLYGGGATTMSTDQFRASYLRSVALNKLYHLGDFGRPSATKQPADTSEQSYRARGEWLNTEYGNAVTRMTSDEFRAMYVRSDALNRLYHLGAYAQSPVAAAPTPAGNGFDWTTAGIAAAATLAALLLTSAIPVARGRHWHIPAAHGH